MQPFWLWNSNKYYILLVFVCSLMYPARNAPASYYIFICGLSLCLYNIFPHCLTTCTVLEKKIIEHKRRTLTFSTTLRNEPLNVPQVGHNLCSVDHSKYRNHLCRLQITKIIFMQSSLTPSNIL